MAGKAMGYSSFYKNNGNSDDNAVDDNTEENNSTPGSMPNSTGPKNRLSTPDTAAMLAKKRAMKKRLASMKGQ
jgi:hypothetical protein